MFGSLPVARQGVVIQDNHICGYIDGWCNGYQWDKTTLTTSSPFASEYESLIGDGAQHVCQKAYQSPNFSLAYKRIAPTPLFDGVLKDYTFIQIPKTLKGLAILISADYLYTSFNREIIIECDRKDIVNQGEKIFYLWCRLKKENIIDLFSQIVTTMIKL